MNESITRARLTGLTVLISAALLSSSLTGARAYRQNRPTHEIVPVVAFVSSRHAPLANIFAAAEIYYMTADGTTVRLTENAVGDGFPALAPGGKRIAFDSNRLRMAGEPINVSDLFVMNARGDDQTHLVRGSSASWSPAGNHLAYHASASGSGQPIRPDPGSPTTDSDIFTLNVDDFIANGEAPRNLTNDLTAVDDDPDWSPHGDVIAFTSHHVSDDHNNPTTTEIYTIRADGSGIRRQLTNNAEEERAPDWSPDGTRIVFMCRRGALTPQGLPTFEICVMNADGTGELQLTANGVPDLSPIWAPGGQHIIFHRPVQGRFQLFRINPDGTGLTQLTDTPGINAFANAGELRLRVPRPSPTP